MNEKIQEILESAKSVEYFVENYCLRKDSKDGYVPFRLNEFQKKYLELRKKQLNLCIEANRQVGSSNAFAVEILHKVLFGSPKSFMVVTPKLESAKNFIKTFKFLYENTADFLKLNKIRVDTKNHIIFENGASLKAISDGSSEAGLCGESLETVYLDQAGYFTQNSNELWLSIAPRAKNFVFCTTVEDSNKKADLFEERKKDPEFYYFEYKN